MAGNPRDGGTEGCGFLSLAELDALLADRLPPDRRDAFAEHVKGGCPACALLAADVEAFRSVERGGVRDGEREEYELRAPMLEARLRRELRGRGAAARASRPRRLAIAGIAAMLVALIGLALYRLPGPAVPGAVLVLPDGGTLTVRPMPFSAPPTVRGAPVPHETWKEAETAYASRRFDRAGELLRAIPEEDPHAADAALYRGVAWLLADRIPEAREALATARRLAEERDLPVGSIRWFEGLAALADGDAPSGRAALAAAEAAGGPYADPARELLERIGDE